MKFPALAPLIALVLSAATEPRIEAADARSLAEAEWAFAHNAKVKGIRPAFLEALSDQSTVFLPGPQDGKTAWGARKDSGAELLWHPVIAVVAASGDLGYTTGPSIYKKADKSFYGQFVSIWRQEHGKWKVIFDIGSDTPQPAGLEPELQTLDLKSPNESKGGDVFAAERAFSEGLPATFASMAASEVILLRAGKSPALGKRAGLTLRESANEPSHFAKAKGVGSKAGDLGFVWGEYNDAGGGYYVRVWRRNEAGQWQLALDLLNPR